MKRTLAALTLTVFAFALLCSCKPQTSKNTGGDSSTAVGSGFTVNSEITTESAPSQTAQNNSSKKEDDKNTVSSDKQEVNSPDSNGSSSKEDNDNYGQNTSWNTQTSGSSQSGNSSAASNTGTASSNGTSTGGTSTGGTSTGSSSTGSTASDNTSSGSSSTSESIKVQHDDSRSVVFCGMSTGTANSYGSTREDAFREIEDVAKAGYMNSLSDRGLLKYDEYWDIIIENDMTVWYSAFAVFDSSKETLEEYMSQLHNIIDNYVKPYPERWERFNGFWYDEKIWRGESNEDFIAETQHVYQRYGKRTYAVLATGEFTSIEGNDIGVSGEEMSKIKTRAFKYISDVGFDSYGIDVRDGAPNGNIKTYYQNVSKDIKDGPSYYREYTRILLELVGHPVNLWYLPCAYTTSIKGGLGGIKKADEQYCLAHLNFFYEELKKQTYSGGLMLYVYGLSQSTEDGGKKGLKYFLEVKNDNGSGYKIQPQTEKWKSYSKRLKEIVKEYNENPVVFYRNLG